MVDKEQLFLSVIEETIAPVTNRCAEIAERHLGTITDLERDLIAFSRDWVHMTVLFPEHAALLRLVIAEATHFPQAVDTWRHAGAGQSRRALSEHLRRIADQGLLDIDDVDEAARHLTALVCNPPQGLSFFGTLPLADTDILLTRTSTTSSPVRYTPSCGSTNRPTTSLSTHLPDDCIWGRRELRAPEPLAGLRVTARPQVLVTNLAGGLYALQLSLPQLMQCRSRSATAPASR